MKTIVILLAVSFVAVLGELTKEDHAKYEQYEKDCMDELDIDPATFLKLNQEKSDENDEKLACFNFCLLKKYEIFKEDEKIDWDKFRAEMSKHDVPQDKIDEICDKCKDVDGEGCQKGKNLIKCMQDVKGE
ncbi:PREDICTED: uncharacterized protein LOC105153708 [Acromyrmex echinatior]|uniref:uncharacterized protein LOC105153708 n=1 Tax=Acromyrmex echinatior TaxID=103372 RepID=UPI000580FE7C|nr:PREDICTED: uncharacterized protein LOC105153708 [Acromyrmex echinatior]